MRQKEKFTAILQDVIPFLFLRLCVRKATIFLPSRHIADDRNQQYSVTLILPGLLCVDYHATELYWRANTKWLRLSENICLFFDLTQIKNTSSLLFDLENSWCLVISKVNSAIHWYFNYFEWQYKEKSVLWSFSKYTLECERCLLHDKIAAINFVFVKLSFLFFSLCFFMVHHPHSHLCVNSFMQSSLVSSPYFLSSLYKLLQDSEHSMYAWLYSYQIAKSIDHLPPVCDHLLLLSWSSVTTIQFLGLPACHLTAKIPPLTFLLAFWCYPHELQHSPTPSLQISFSFSFSFSFATFPITLPIPAPSGIATPSLRKLLVFIMFSSCDQSPAAHSHLDLAPTLDTATATDLFFGGLSFSQTAHWKLNQC